MRQAAPTWLSTVTEAGWWVDASEACYLRASTAHHEFRRAGPEKSFSVFRPVFKVELYNHRPAQ